MLEQLTHILKSVRIRPLRLLLETPRVEATIPMLRGVWGAALHDLDPTAYAAVFHSGDNGPPATGPSYILRPAPPDPAFAPALDWILIGPALEHATALDRAWDIASGMGLGRDRCRFHIRRVVALQPNGQSIDTSFGGWTGAEPSESRGWVLGDLTWPIADPENAPCQLVFPAPLRLRRHGRLIEAPTLPDLIANLTRRIAQFLTDEFHADWTRLSSEALQLARQIPARTWSGSRLDLHRYSASQKAELDVHGVSGSLELPRGPGPLWLLLAAAQWLHIGKSTVLGLGQLCVRPLESTRMSP